MEKSKQYKDVPPPQPAKNPKEEKKINEQLLKDLETEQSIDDDNPSLADLMEKKGLKFEVPE